MEYGLIVAVEGIDKAGKSTVVDELAKMFAIDGEEVVIISFPDYDTPSGRIIREILDGYHSLSVKHNPYEVQALYVINRYEQQDRILEAVMNGKIVLFDRYLHSSLVYGASTGVDEGWLNSIQSSLVKPDITILLDISLQEYNRRKKGYNLDMYEQNTQLIESVRNLYLQYAQAEGWIIVNAEKNIPLLVQEIYTSIQRKINEMAGGIEDEGFSSN